MDATQPLASALDTLAARLARVEQALGLSGPAPAVAAAPAPAPGKAAPAAAAVELSPALAAYDEYVAQYLPPFRSACEKLGEETKTLGAITQKAFDAQRAYLLMASQCKKPASLNPDHLKDLQESIKEMNGLRDNRSAFANHQNMVSEGIQALGWICVEPAPKPFIESYVGGSDFWGNKIRVQYKTSNPDQVEFVSAFKTLLLELMAYVKEHHTTGVTWNPKGQETSAYSAAAPAAAAPTAQAPAKAGGLNSVFAGIRSIDQSAGHTAGLRKVTKDQQTWRKEFKGDGAAPAPAAPVAAKPKPVAAPVAKVVKPPVCELRNGNWSVENQVGGAPVVVKDLNMKQQVYIYGCNNATIVLEGKAKSIVLDTCKSTKLLFDDAVSSLEIVNCTKAQVQCKGKVPSVAIDKTDGCLVYISWAGRDVQFVTSKSSEMNVAFPASEGSDEMTERPIPEQFVHKIQANATLSSDVSDLYSH